MYVVIHEIEKTDKSKEKAHVADLVSAVSVLIFNHPST